MIWIDELKACMYSYDESAAVAGQCSAQLVAVLIYRTGQEQDATSHIDLPGHPTREKNLQPPALALHPYHPECNPILGCRSTDAILQEFPRAKICQ